MLKEIEDFLDKMVSNTEDVNKEDFKLWLSMPVTKSLMAECSRNYQNLMSSLLKASGDSEDLARKSGQLETLTQIINFRPEMIDDES